VLKSTCPVIRKKSFRTGRLVLWEAFEIQNEKERNVDEKVTWNIADNVIDRGLRNFQ
jgi:hypothetical protein